MNAVKRGKDGSTFASAALGMYAALRGKAATAVHLSKSVGGRGWSHLRADLIRQFRDL